MRAAKYVLVQTNLRNVPAPVNVEGSADVALDIPYARHDPGRIQLNLVDAIGKSAGVLPTHQMLPSEQPKWVAALGM